MRGSGRLRLRLSLQLFQILHLDKPIGIGHRGEGLGTASRGGWVLPLEAVGLERDPMRLMGQLGLFQIFLAFVAGAPDWFWARGF